MTKYLVFTFTLIGGILVWMSFQLGVSFPETGLSFVPPSPYAYQNPREAIDHILVGVVYFVPKNKIRDAVADWQALVTPQVKDLELFHKKQFQNSSLIKFLLYPRMAMGLEENRIYDTDITQHGNPEATISVFSELGSRMLSPEGDLFWEEFALNKASPKVLYIIYEGVGASGTKGVALLSRKFFSDPQYADHVSSLFAHEFYHTIGLVDRYDDTGNPLSMDLMGAGRFLPLSSAYLDRETLRALGL